MRTTVLRAAATMLVGVLLTACGQEPSGAPAEDFPTETTVVADRTIPSPTSTTATTPPLTYPVEFERMAEDYGVSLERVEEIVIAHGQIEQALTRLYELFGDGVIAGAAVGSEAWNADVLTIYAVDSDAATLIEAHLEEAGLGSIRTRVEVAPPPPVQPPWEWLAEPPYAGQDWLISPGPHVMGGWELVESNGVVPDPTILGSFGGSGWAVDLCSGDLGWARTSVEGYITVTIEREGLECDPVVEGLLFSLVEANQGRFALSSDEGTMTWTGDVDGKVVWRQHERSDHVDFYARDYEAALEAWLESPGPAMEGVWRLSSLAGRDPAAPVGLHIGVSTVQFEGLCNWKYGTFALRIDGRMATSLDSTARGCGGPDGGPHPTQVVEEDIVAFLTENQAGFLVAVEEATMTWHGPTADLVWAR